MMTQLTDLLAAGGIRRLFDGTTSGVSVPLDDLGIDLLRVHVIRVEDVEVATMLADADGRVGDRTGRGRLGVALLDGPILHVSSQPGGLATPETVETIDDLATGLAHALHETAPTTAAFHLAGDLAAVLVEPSADVSDPGSADRPVPTLPPVALDAVQLSPQIEGTWLIGPGAIRSGCAAEVRAAIERTGFVAFNTWGGKGIVPFDHPLHGGTIGLQAGDWALAGITDGTIVFGVGLDKEEVGSALDGVILIEIDPRVIDLAVAGWPEAPAATSERTTFYTAVAGAIAADGGGLAPEAAQAAELAHLVEHDGLLVADADEAGFWIARCGPTVRPGSIVVPALASPGFAAAAAWIAALDVVECVAVTAGPSNEAAQATERVVAAGADAFDAEDIVSWAPKSTGGTGAEGVHGRTAAQRLIDVAGTPIAWSGVRA